MSEQKSPEIQFEALTSGLGFHPFSDGLPYAPVSKKANTTATTPMGTGAVAAGAPSFVRPTASPAPRISVPVAVAKPAPAPARAIEKTTVVGPSYGFLYLLKRVCAFTLDLSLNVSLLAAGLSFTLWNQEIQPEVLMNPGIAFISVLFFALFHWALVTAQEVLFGTSVGKRVFGLALRGSVAAIFLRAFFFLPSAGFCGVGLLWSVFDRQRRCWHDLVANVQPIEVARL